MKKALSVMVATCLMVIAFFNLFCLSACNESFKWDNLEIKNYANYTSFGVAKIDSITKKQKNVSSLQTAEDDTNVKLVGVTESKIVEEVIFVDSGNKETKQDEHIVFFETNNKYSLLFYSNDNSICYKGSLLSCEEYVDREKGIILEYNDEEGDTRVGLTLVTEQNGIRNYKFNAFILNNSTGKIYNVSAIINKTGANYLQFFNFESNLDKIIFGVTNDNTYKKFDGIYKLEFSEDGIEYKQIINSKKISDFITDDCFDIDKLRFDAFGNIFYGSEVFTDGINYLRADGKLCKLKLSENQTCFIATNQITYSFEEKTNFNAISNTTTKEIVNKYYLNEKGKFVVVDNGCEISNYYVDNNSNYERTIATFSDSENCYVINSKVSYNENKCSVNIELFTMGKDVKSSPNNKTFLIKEISGDNALEIALQIMNSLEYYNGNLYGFIDGNMACFSIESGLQKDLTLNYIISYLEKDRLQNLLIFSGTDNLTTEEICGYITYDHEIAFGEYTYSVIGAKKVYFLIGK